MGRRAQALFRRGRRHHATHFLLSSFNRGRPGYQADLPWHDSVHPGAGGTAQTNIPRSTASNPNGNNPVAVNGGDFGSRFPWYVELIRRKTAQNWLVQEVSSSTPAGAKVYLSFVVSRDGSPSQIRIAQSSGSPSLDTSCLRAVQRVDSYGPLPGGYNGSSLSVSYYCEEPGH